MFVSFLIMIAFHSSWLHHKATPNNLIPKEIRRRRGAVARKSVAKLQTITLISKYFNT